MNRQSVHRIQEHAASVFATMLSVVFAVFEDDELVKQRYYW